MARNSDIALIKLILNSQQAEEKLEKLKKKLTELHRKRKEALDNKDYAGAAIYNKEINKIERQVARLETRAQTAARVLTHLDKAAPKQLKDTIRELNRELNNGSVERGSKAWKVLTQQLAAAKGELQRIKEESAASDKGLAGLGQKWAGAYALLNGLSANISGAFSSMRSYVDAYAETAEHMAAVTKYTGLAAKDVEALNESFRKMDTRTPRAALNDLAAEAGRLGIQGKQEVLDFVEAANQINVALGEDLGEGAVRNIGKLAQLFGDADRMGLKKAMLATGSVINELAQSSSASEGYIMDFTARLSGMAKQAGMTQAQVMGLASVMDQAMVQSEEGATALSRLIQQLYQRPAELARAVGLDVKQFTQQVKTDANAALIEFAQAAERLGGMDALAPRLKELDLTGAGVTKTVTALANNIDTLRATQQQADEAFRQATSVTKEYDQANNTVQANLEKQRQRIADLRASLGEQLLPVMESGLTVTQALWKAFLVVSRFIPGHVTTILTLAAAVAVLTAAVKIASTAQQTWANITTVAHKIQRAYTLMTNASTRAVILDAAATRTATTAQKAWNYVTLAGHKILLSFRALLGLLKVALIAVTQGTRAAALAMRELRVALASNPWGLALLAITVLGAAIWGLYEALKETRSENKKLAEEQARVAKEQQEIASGTRAISAAQKQAADSTVTEIARLRTLRKVAADASASYADRRNAIKQLEAIVPGYHASLSKEGKLIESNARSIDDYIKKLQSKALAEAAYDTFVQLQKKVIDAGYKVSRKENNVRKVQESINKEPWKYQELEFSEDNGKITRNYKGFNKGREGQQKKKEYEAQTRALSDAQRDLKNYQDEAQSFFNFFKADKNVSDAFLKLIGQGGKGTPSAGAGYGGGAAAGTAAGGKGTGTATGTPTSPSDNITRQLEIDKAAQEIAYRSGLVDRQTYEDNIYHLEETALNKRIALTKAGTKERTDAELALVKLRNDREAQLTAGAFETIDEEKKRRQDEALEAYAKGTISEEQYQDRLTQIDLDALRQRATQAEADYQANRSPQALAERDKAVDAYNQALDNDRKEKARTFQEQLKAIREQYGVDELTSLKARQQQMEQILEQARTQGLIDEETYQRLLLKIRQDYADKTASITSAKPAERSAADRRAEGQWLPDTSKLGAPSDQLSSGMLGLYGTIADLQDKIKHGGTEWQDWAKVGVAGIQLVSAGLSSASQLFQAQQQAEEAAITAKYDKEIKAAGNNSARAKRLEEKKQKELAAIKNKYNRKQMAIEIAQAIAQTAVNAISAYGAMAKIPVVGPALGAAAAAAAVAAGMIQVAAIKKQHEAQAAGYYEGGYTPDPAHPRRTVGVVHGGEFVVNNRAVRNPALSPLLNLIDRAQRTRTVARLTPADVSRTILAPQIAAAGAGSAAHSLTSLETTATAGGILTRPADTAAADSLTAVATATAETQARAARAIDRLTDRLDEGITATCRIDGNDGVAQSLKRYERLRRN